MRALVLRRFTKALIWSDIVPSTPVLRALKGAFFTLRAEFGDLLAQPFLAAVQASGSDR